MTYAYARGPRAAVAHIVASPGLSVCWRILDTIRQPSAAAAVCAQCQRKVVRP